MNVGHTGRREAPFVALLVIGVLFMLLGNLRAGLVVAITIPLSLLVLVSFAKHLEE